MRIMTAMLLAGVALVAQAGAAMADGTIDVDKLAAQAAPVLPPGTRLMVISKTAQPEVPGLPLSTKDLNRMGPNATTIRILPATGEAGDGSVSWSGYTRTGVIYQGSK
ncbi:hypothetical protein DK847_01470 [Aestuariivirga litoralis]|uniref:Uncharacterized protein n=1 Tax=Aestuariivirga litoralis TaxID=2650924 RepID=A0A2W2BE64_9HYPH|nr:hypothetical protein [Aestuariivirga litoralis]PZF78508.1 hypothetical protein DK847_01470 [Aestuariivirga litoralis]